MATSQDFDSYLTPEAYLEQERQAQTESEFYAGEVYAMAGASGGTYSSLRTRLLYLDHG